MMETKT